MCDVLYFRTVVLAFLILQFGLSKYPYTHFQCNSLIFSATTFIVFKIIVMNVWKWAANRSIFYFILGQMYTILPRRLGERSVCWCIENCFHIFQLDAKVPTYLPTRRHGDALFWFTWICSERTRRSFAIDWKWHFRLI